MKNFIQPGAYMTLLAAPYAVASGAGVLMGSMFGVAAVDIASGASGEIATAGVFNMAKATGQAWTQGAKLYWDNTNKNVTTTSSANTLIGVAATTALSGDTVGAVRLGIVA